MNKPKKWLVNNDSQIHVTVTHKRNKRRPRYSFSIVINSLVLSAALISTIALSTPVYATTPVNTVVATQTINQLERLAGQNRYETASQIALSGWTQSDYAILAYGGNFPDALAASPLASKLNAPILLTENNTLSSQAQQVITQLNVKHVFIVDGEAVLSQNIDSQLSKQGVQVTRLSDTSRYNISVKVANQLTSPTEAFIVNGDAYADTLSVGAVAGKLCIPILLVQKDTIPSQVQSYLKSNNIIKTYVIGGTGVISDTLLKSLPNPERISGENRYETNIAVLNKFSTLFRGDKVAIATGEGYADALAGAAYASKNSIPVVLIPKSGVNPTTQSYLKQKSSTPIIFGGEGVVPTQQVNAYTKNTFSSPTINDEILAENLYQATDKLNALLKNNTLATQELKQLANRLLEIEQRLNSTNTTPSTNVIQAIKYTDKALSDTDTKLSTITKQQGSPQVLQEARDTLNRVKTKAGLQTAQSQTTDSQAQRTIYAGKATNSLSGQQLSLTPQQGLNKITVRYGHHVYNSETQDEYNAVMKAIDDSMQKVTLEDSYYNRIVAYKNGTADVRISKWVTSNYSDDIINLSDSELQRLFKAINLALLAQDYTGVLKGTDGYSAYTVIYNHQGNCVGTAHLQMAAFDSYGYNTRMLGSPGHAWVEFELTPGVWYSLDSAFRAPVSTIPTYTIVEHETFSGKF